MIRICLADEESRLGNTHPQALALQRYIVADIYENEGKGAIANALRYYADSELTAATWRTLQEQGVKHGIRGAAYMRMADEQRLWDRERQNQMMDQGAAIREAEQRRFPRPLLDVSSFLANNPSGQELQEA